MNKYAINFTKCCLSSACKRFGSTHLVKCMKTHAGVTSNAMDFVAESVRLRRPRCHILISWKLLLISSLTFTVVIIPHKICAQDLPADNNLDSAPALGQKMSTSCTPPKSINGKNHISCSGYSEIPPDIIDSREIQILDMSSGNSLQTLTDGQLSKANLGGLFNLILKKCDIRTIHRNAFSTSGGNVITDLDLSENNIEVLDPEVFGGLANLRTLILRGNPINRFQTEKVFPPGLSGLTNIDLSFCELDSLPDNAFDNLRIEKLYLNNNQLKTLTWRVFRNVPLLNHLSLHDNPWHCDCHVKFLIDILREKHLTLSIQQSTCATSPSANSLAGVKWDVAKLEDLTCHPTIEKLNYENYDVHGRESGVNEDYNAGEGGTPEQSYHNGDLTNDKGPVKLKQDVFFECTFSGYPRPEIKWLKDSKDFDFTKDESAAREMPSVSGEQARNINNDQSDNNSPSPSQSTPTGIKPRIEIQENTNMIVNTLDKEEKKRAYKFSELLIVRQVQKEDRGLYTCIVTNSAGLAEKAVFLNFTVPLEDELFLGGIGGRKRVAVWIWILVALLSVLIIILLSLIICVVWRRHEKRKQKRYREVVKDKFKDSNVDLGEFIDLKATSPQSQKSTKDAIVTDGTTPLF
ncbi:unnamed protein product [Orchesella dallaii]|uniref:Ig-like domain-containing protein n=1 Tax=Orchesella dallaii TaxID=48710 RepID=A0ABP1Q9U4_9HEXA